MTSQDAIEEQQRRRDPVLAFEEAVLQGKAADLAGLYKSQLIDLAHSIPYMTLRLPPIFVAVLRGDINSVKELLKCGDSLHRQYNHLTPIEFAINLQKDEGFILALKFVGNDAQFDKIKVLKHVLTYREKKMYEELRRYVRPLPSPISLKLDSDVPNFYYLDYSWQCSIRLLYLHKHKVLPWSRIPLNLLRVIIQYE